MRRILSMLAIAATSLTLPVTPPAHGGELTPSVPYENYVSMGDSFAAGPLIPFPKGAGCLASKSNFPEMLADRLALRLTSFRDVACSGAISADLQSRGKTLTGGSRPPQLEALFPQTDLVTLSIGANDENFFGALVSSCPQLARGEPDGNPCQRQFTSDGVDRQAAIIPRTERRLNDVLKAIKRRAPQATVVVSGYLRIVPANLQPCSALGLARGDISWLDDLQQQLNLMMKRVSQQNDAVFVDNYALSEGRDPCAGQDRWVQGKSNDLFAAAAFHPNRAGMTAVARHIYTTLMGRDLAVGKQAIASSSQRRLGAERAVDGNTETRWSSRWLEGQTIDVDLGQRQTVRRMELRWESAFARGYRVWASTNARTWRPIWETRTSDGQRDSIALGPLATRYLRVEATRRATAFGVSLYDLEVYAAASPR